MTPSLLAAELRRFLLPRSIIVGVGNVRRGDDGFGPAVVRSLQERVAFDLVEAGICPENYLGAIVRRSPSRVLVLDAAELGYEPGSLKLCAPRDVVSAGISCHAGSLTLFTGYIEAMTGADCRLLLVQPDTTRCTPESACESGDLPGRFGVLSPAVGAAVRQVSAAIIDAERTGPIFLKSRTPVS